MNRTKSRVRAKVEHAILVIKRIFGFSKVRYRGLAKNTHWLFISCGLTNLTWLEGASWQQDRSAVPSERQKDERPPANRENRLTKDLVVMLFALVEPPINGFLNLNSN
jgi:hypothetical protein